MQKTTVFSGTSALIVSVCTWGPVITVELLKFLLHQGKCFWNHTSCSRSTVVVGSYDTHLMHVFCRGYLEFQDQLVWVDQKEHRFVVYFYSGRRALSLDFGSILIFVFCVAIVQHILYLPHEMDLSLHYQGYLSSTVWFPVKAFQTFFHLEINKLFFCLFQNRMIQYINRNQKSYSKPHKDDI